MSALPVIVKDPTGSSRRILHDHRAGRSARRGVVDGPPCGTAESATLDAMETLATPQLNEYFEVLRHEIDRMTDLMRDLLAYGRPSAPNLTRFTAGEIIAAAVDSG